MITVFLAALAADGCCCRRSDLDGRLRSNAVNAAANTEHAPAAASTGAASSPGWTSFPIFPPSQPAPQTSAGIWWGAIGFTADGSYSTVWKMASQAEAEATVAKKCAEYGHGACKVVAISGPECVALSTFNGSHKRRRWNLSFTAGGNTYPEATRTAMDRCNSDERSQGRCQFRVAACADGR